MLTETKGKEPRCYTEPSICLFAGAKVGVFSFRSKLLEQKVLKFGLYGLFKMLYLFLACPHIGPASDEEVGG